MSLSSIIFIEGSQELAERIEPLWIKLNDIHIKKSIYFSDKFNRFTFEHRKNGIFSKDEKVLCILVMDSESNKDIGYVIASIDNHRVGEIDSLYIENKYRGENIGGELINKSTEWLKENNAKQIKIGVAVGNEDVMKLYERHNFYPKVTILEFRD